jgi:nitrogen fixation/metabolism regulation signal transduction histidine kinase
VTAARFPDRNAALLRIATGLVVLALGFVAYVGLDSAAIADAVGPNALLVIRGVVAIAVAATGLYRIVQGALWLARLRFPLQLKLTIALVIIVMTPLAAVAYFIGDITTTAANLSAEEAAERVDVMERAKDHYLQLFETTKHLHAATADRLAKLPELLALDPKVDLEKLLDAEGSREAGLRAIAVVRADGTTVAEAGRPLPGPLWRDKRLDEPLGTAGDTLHLTFEVPATLQSDYQELNRSIQSARITMQARSSELPAGMRNAFMLVIGVAALAAVIVGIVMSTYLTRRIARLVVTAREVSEGQLDARVELRGHDEMAELGTAFNTMLDDLDQTRTQVQYLQRIGAWQDVARRLAHEIKNPLTPIQLAVQQAVSQYKGDDARYAKLLADTREIVEEEISGLRRLVDTFRTLGQLPKVEKAPIALADVLEELRLDPVMAKKLELVAPDRPVTVRADKLLLKRVIANLVENGMHAGQEAGGDGGVRVSWHAKRDVVTITVDDHGKGIAAADRERIFEPYVTTKSTGTGLGLAIARKIAIEHGGELAIAPERAPTGGARFVVTLPLHGPDSSMG